MFTNFKMFTIYKHRNTCFYLTDVHNFINVHKIVRARQCKFVQVLNWCSQTSKCSQFCKHRYKYVTLYIYNMPNKECSQFPQNQIYKIMKASTLCKFKLMCKAQNYVNDNGITKAHICLINVHKITSNWFTWWANPGYIPVEKHFWAFFPNTLLVS